MRSRRARSCCVVGDAGFTLIELLVVLVVIVGVTSIAYAGLVAGYPRIKAAYERDDLERQLLEMPQRVRSSGHGGILTSHSGDDLPDDTLIAVEGVSETTKSIEDLRVLRVSLPSGWQMRVAAPILYHFSGSCEGGEVGFLLPPVSLQYVLLPPLCRPIRRDAR